MVYHEAVSCHNDAHGSLNMPTFLLATTWSLASCLLVEAYSELPCCCCLIQNGCISMHLHSMYRAVLDGRRAVMSSGAKSQSRTKIDDHNNHQEKDKTATMAGFASHFNTTTNRSDYLRLLWIESTYCRLFWWFVGSQGTFLVR